ncbi:MAG TPA: biotin/lipoyl-containing protein [Bacillota bacterium]|nr:biotin/lipoyl-containing protein [Bacillota bacterium]
MRKFRVTVDGRPYEVVVEELAGERRDSPPAAIPPPPPPAARPAAPGRPAPTAPAARGSGQAVPVGFEPVRAPLPGLVVDVRVHPGDQIAVGQVVVVLEAMKMENEIASPVAGSVGEVRAAKGTTVDVGDILALIKLT